MHLFKPEGRWRIEHESDIGSHHGSTEARRRSRYWHISSVAEWSMKRQRAGRPTVRILIVSSFMIRSTDGASEACPSAAGQYRTLSIRPLYRNRAFVDRCSERVTYPNQTLHNLHAAREIPVVRKNGGVPGDIDGLI